MIELVYENNLVKIFVENINLENSTDVFSVVKLVTDKGEMIYNINPYNK
jgi:hypothetical protein